MYCILHTKPVEFPCHKFSSSSSFDVVFLAHSLDSRYLGFFVSCVYWYNRWWL